jgi:trk system potassium uptake protein TrkA
MAGERVVAVFGLGTFGQEVCRYLSRNGARVIAVDNDARLVERIKDEVRQAVLLDSTDEEALKSAPLEDVDAAVVAIGENIEASILTTALLKQVGVPRIVARATNELQQKVLRTIGADQVVNPEIEEARRLASRLLSQDVLDAIPISEDFSIAEVFVPEVVVGESLAAIRERYDVNVMALKRVRTSVDDTGNPVRTETVSLPRDNEVLQDGDIVLVVGRNANVEKIRGEPA